jgi:hypothetical protein
VDVGGRVGTDGADGPPTGTGVGVGTADKEGVADEEAVADADPGATGDPLPTAEASAGGAVWAPAGSEAAGAEWGRWPGAPVLSNGWHATAATATAPATTNGVTINPARAPKR